MEKKNLVMVCLCAVIAVMAVAYAAFSTTLTVDGTINTLSEWGVEFLGDGSCTPTAAGIDSPEPTGTFTKQTATTAQLVAQLKTPTDKIVCTIPIKNVGNLAARQGTNGLVIGGGLTAVSTPIAMTCTADSTLAAGATGEVSCTLTYNWSAQTQPTGGLSAGIEITLNYEQAI